MSKWSRFTFSALLLLSAASGRADTGAGSGSSVNSIYSMDLSRADLNAALSEGSRGYLKGSISIPIPDVTTGAPFPVRLSGIQVNLNYQLETPVLDPKTQIWSINSSRLSGEIVIQKMDATQIIHQSIGNVHMDIRVNGSCSQVHLALAPGNARASATGHLDFVNGKTVFPLQSFSASWNPGSWHVTSLDCQGPPGFSPFVSQNAELQMRQIDPFLASIRDSLQAWIDQALSGPLPLSVGSIQTGPIRTKGPSLPNPEFKTSMMAERFDVSPATHSNPQQDRVHIAGHVAFLYPNVPANAGCNAVIDRFEDKPSSVVSGDSFTVPADAFRAVVNCSQIDRSLKYNTDSTQIEGCSKLVGSRIRQLLAWPDLMRFKSDSVFLFSAAPTAAPEFTDLKPSGEHQIALNLNVPLAIDMQAPMDGNYIPYTHMTASYSGPATVKIENGEATLITAHDIPLHLSIKYDPSYLDEHVVDKMIWTGKIEGSVREALSTKGLTLPLPVFNLSPETQIQFIDGDLDGSAIRFSMSLSRTSTSVPQ